MPEPPHEIPPAERPHRNKPVFGAGRDNGTGGHEGGDSPPPITRRRFLGLGAAATSAAAAAGLPRRLGRLFERALAVEGPRRSSLSDIEHVVILMQENRSFDHYYGTMSGVRGFSDPRVLRHEIGGRSYPVFDQFGYAPGAGPDAHGYLQPFHLAQSPPKRDGQTTNDITHSWGPQHESWNHGRMDRFVRTHLSADGNPNGLLTMGYFTRQDLAFYYALADAFTICDGYHCSVLGPTDPNRLMWISASIDPAGRHGGPVLETFTDRQQHYATLSWETMPERLTKAGVSWKVYNDPTALLELSPFPYFKQYWDPSTSLDRELFTNGILPTYPAQFEADVRAGSLPAVSWIMSPLAECEHPAAPPEYGEYLVSQVLSTLVSDPELWAKTVFFVVYDENGGFFDHVPPPVATDGTAGEWLTVKSLPSAAAGIRGPIGLGFRVPCLVVSPFSRGGWVTSEIFDHTSLLRFVERRFGVEVPNLSSWRRSVTGDLTGALALTRADTSVPALPPTSLGDTRTAEQAVINALAGTEDVGTTYPPPTANRMPHQASKPPRRRIG